MSSTRSYASTLDSVSTSGSSSTYSRMTEPSGALTIVWPVVAKPNAASPYGIGHVSWKPLRKNAGSCDGTPSSCVPRMPM